MMMISLSVVVPVLRKLPDKKNPNLDYTRGITPKRVTNDRAHLGGLAPGQYRNVAAGASR